MDTREDGQADEAGQLTFAPTFSASGLRLIELDDHVLEAFTQNASMSFVGEDNDNVVFCTDTRTYMTKVADTSNMLMIVSAEDNDRTLDFDQEREVVGRADNVLELTWTRPRSHKLAALLKECPYGGDPVPDGRMYTWDDLANRIAASITELKGMLHSVHAFEHDGCWRVLDDSYASDTFDLILTTIEANGWPMSAVQLGDVCKEVAAHDIPPFVVKCLLARYGEPAEGDDETYSLQPDRVARFRALEFLRMGETWQYDSFMASWKGALPDDMDVSDALLQGLAIIKERKGPSGELIEKTVTYFPEDELPSDVRERFSRLFASKECWTYDEIAPYLRPLETPSMSVDKLLFKHARAFTRNGHKMYNRR